MLDITQRSCILVDYTYIPLIGPGKTLSNPLVFAQLNRAQPEYSTLAASKQTCYMIATGPFDYSACEARHLAKEGKARTNI